jgi:hypothetical protein
MKNWQSWPEQDDARLRSRSKCLYAGVLLLCVAMVGLGAMQDQPAVWAAGLVLSGALCVQILCVWYFSPREGRVSTCRTCPPSTL